MPLLTVGFAEMGYEWDRRRVEPTDRSGAHNVSWIPFQDTTEDLLGIRVVVFALPPPLNPCNALKFVLYCHSRRSKEVVNARSSDLLITQECDIYVDNVVLKHWMRVSIRRVGQHAILLTGETTYST
jgi:hypothetical protein